jgi:hypothetical protein
MPFGISDTQSDCSTWATVKQESDGTFTTIGCHASKQDAIDQMVVVSMSEDIDPIGDVSSRSLDDLLMTDTEDEIESESELLPRQSALYELYEKIAEVYGMWNQGNGADGAHYVAESPFADNGLICANCVFYEGGRGCEIVAGDIAPAGICKLWVIAERLVAEPAEPEESSMGYEARADVDLSAPEYMRASARRGLELHEQGLSGDGLMPATVDDARRMAAGEIGEAKWRKIGAWIARHIGDLDAVEGDEITAGLVAMLLWGGGSTKESALRAQQYAEQIVERLDSEQTRCADNSAPTMIEPMSTTEQIEHRWCITGADERRVAYTTLEMREDVAGNRLIGYAAVFDSPSEPMPFTEYVKRGAFQKTIKDGADVRLLIDHEGVPLARTKSGTLMLEEDERGLKVIADLDPLNPDAARVISAMRRGDMSQMSFAFRTIKDAWSDDRSVRELREVQLFDVSVVTFPAYEATVAELRNAKTATTISPTTSVSVRKAQIALARQR